MFTSSQYLILADYLDLLHFLIPYIHNHITIAPIQEFVENTLLTPDVWRTSRIEVIGQSPCTTITVSLHSLCIPPVLHKDTALVPSAASRKHLQNSQCISCYEQSSGIVWVRDSHFLSTPSLHYEVYAVYQQSYFWHSNIQQRSLCPTRVLFLLIQSDIHTVWHAVYLQWEEYSLPCSLHMLDKDLENLMQSSFSDFYSLYKIRYMLLLDMHTCFARAFSFLSITFLNASIFQHLLTTVSGMLTLWRCYVVEEYKLLNSLIRLAFIQPTFVRTPGRYHLHRCPQRI